MELDKERKARLEKMVATTQLRLALETKKSKKWILIWIEIGVFKKQFFSRNELTCSVMGTIFLVML